MRHLTRIRIAVLAAAFFLGGVTAAGVGMRAGQDPSTRVVTARPRTQVIHETRTRTVHVKARHARTQAAPPAAAPQVAPVQQAGPVAQAPAIVRSRVSPTGHREEGDEGEHEAHDE